MSPLLVLDAGNTRLKWALFDAPRPGAARLAGGACALVDIDGLADGPWADATLPGPEAAIGCIVAGDAARARVEAQLARRWGLPVRWMRARAAQCGVENGYDEPERLGPDRWAALVGARRRVPDAPALVVTAGTAVTVDALSAAGRFLGGLILPGFDLMQRSLVTGTAGLAGPEGRVTDFPTRTADAMTSGAAFAIAGAVTRMHAALAEHENRAPALLVGGGAAPGLMPLLDASARSADTLIMDGLLAMAAEA